MLVLNVTRYADIIISYLRHLATDVVIKKLTMEALRINPESPTVESPGDGESSQAAAFAVLEAEQQLLMQRQSSMSIAEERTDDVLGGDDGAAHKFCQLKGNKNATYPLTCSEVSRQM